MALSYEEVREQREKQIKSMFDRLGMEYDREIQSLHQQYEIEHEYLESWLDKAFRLSRRVNYLYRRPIDEIEFKTLQLVMEHLDAVMTLLSNELIRIDPLRTNNITPID
jgi:hypothetical protein